MVGVACHEASSVHREDSKAVVPMAASHQNLVVGGEDKQLGADYQILSKWSPHILPAGPAASMRRGDEEEEEREWKRKLMKKRGVGGD